MRRILVDYDRLIQSPERELQRLSAALGDAGLAYDAETARAFATGFITTGLRHSVTTPEQLQASSQVLPVVRDAYAQMLVAAQEAGGLDDVAMGEPWKAVESAYEDLSTICRYVDRTSAEIEQARVAYSSQVARLEHEKACWDEQVSARSSVEALLEQVREALGRNVQDHIQTHRRIEALSRAVDELTRTRGSVELVEPEAQALSAALDRMRSTLSWKITAPLRVVHGRITRLFAPPDK
jgi:hypothetical protein